MLPSGLASPPAITQWSPRKDVLSAAEQQSDCVTAARICWESQHCAALYENFSKVCSRKAKECKHPGGRQLCAALRKSLTETLLWTCQCNNSSHVACSQIWKSLFEDVCIQDAQMNEVPTLSEDLGVEVGQDSVSGWYAEMNSGALSVITKMVANIYSLILTQSFLYLLILGE